MRSLSSLSNLSSHDFHSILDFSFYFKQKINKNGYLPQAEQVLQHQKLISLFFENSTRTLLSFKNAIELLGGQVDQFNLDSSSLKKGESFEDTISTFKALRYKGVIIRTGDQSLVREMAEMDILPFINAGSSCHAHPSQALLDLMSLQENNCGKNICIIGDIKHSRVAKSLFRLLPVFGFKIHLYSPNKWLDKDCQDFTIIQNKNELKEMDVLYCLRIQKERQEKDNMDSNWYFENYGITQKDLLPHQWIMHPGPINRMLDIHPNILELPNCLINNQVENGIFARMGILQWIYYEKNEFYSQSSQSAYC
ncbi:hypothetical protein N9N67_08960 [Bacteriovoracaceae bacterium]|nr:hypothetical protein [Bacteriovoracaceae bacterium]